MDEGPDPRAGHREGEDVVSLATMCRQISVTGQANRRAALPSGPNARPIRVATWPRARASARETSGPRVTVADVRRPRARCRGDRTPWPANATATPRADGLRAPR